MNIHTFKRGTASVMALALVLTAGVTPVEAKAKKAKLVTKKLVLNESAKKSIVIRNKSRAAKYSFRSAKAKIAAGSVRYSGTNRCTCSITNTCTDTCR